MQSSRRLEREAQRNVELMWLTGRLAPDHKTIADFRRENGPAIQAACAQFVVLCRQLGLFGAALVAIDGSKFKAVNTRDKNFTAYKVKRRIEQVSMIACRRLHSALVLIAAAASVSPALAGGSSMPWEAPLQSILESIEGPVAKIIAVMIIIVTGLTLAFGDTSGGARRLIQIVFGLSIAFAASSFFLSFFSFGGGALV
ncbi:TrbC/VIRB2 family protein [compost metagenome]